MSTGDDPSRLESALADVFSKAPSLPPRESSPGSSSPARTSAPAPAADDDWSVEEPGEEPVELPEIVPATAFPPEPAARGPAAPAQPPTDASAPAPRPTVPATERATSWGDHLAAAPGAGAQLRPPGRRPRVRRVTRVLRHIDPWSTFKVALLFSAVAYVVALTSGVLLWQVADSTGTIDNVERWFTQFGWETFELKGDEIFQNAWVIGLFAAVALTGGLVLLATLFNLVSDIVGGVRMTVLEEEVVERTVSSTRRYVVRRTPVPTDDGAADWGVDDDDDDRSDGAAPSAADRPTARQPATPADDWSVDDDDDDDDDDDAEQPG